MEWNTNAHRHATAMAARDEKGADKIETNFFYDRLKQ